MIKQDVYYTHCAGQPSGSSSESNELWVRFNTHVAGTARRQLYMAAAMSDNTARISEYDILDSLAERVSEVGCMSDPHNTASLAQLAEQG